MTANQVYAILKKKLNRHFLGSTTLTSGQEQQQLNAFAGGTPSDGDQVANLADNSIWMYSEKSGQWSIYSQNTPIDAATNSRLGVVKIGDGIKVNAGEISTDKLLIGLDKVDNVRQYSAENPAPEIITFDGTKYVGDSEYGVFITSKAVKFIPQNLTTAEKAIARKNIGVADEIKQADWKQTNTAEQDYIKNKPYIPEKLSDLTNDNYTVQDPDYGDRVFNSLAQKNQALTQIETNRQDIANLKLIDTDLDDRLEDEIDRSTSTDNQLQNQINVLRGKTQIIGGTNCAVGAEQTTLTQYTRTKTGDSVGRPRAGDTVNIIYDDQGGVRQEQWTYCEITDSTGAVVNAYWEMTAGPPLVQTATETSLGVVQVPQNGGLLIDVDGNITATKQSIGLGKVDNVRQYSESNPAPMKITVDGVEFTGTNKNTNITTGAVLYDRAQNLNSAQQAQARNNIGILNNAQPDWNKAENEDGGILNKPDIPTKTSQLTNDSNFVVDANYVHTDNNFTIAAKDNIKDNTTNIQLLRDRLTQDETDLNAERINRQNADADLQQQIDNLKGVPLYIGSIKTMASTADLTAYVKSKMTRDPAKGDMVSVLDDKQVYMYNGSSWEIYMDATIGDATTTTKGVVQIGTGIAVNEGVISADKTTIGLNYVDNVKQYSLLNPVPMEITLDGVTTMGTSATGVDITTDYVRYSVAQDLTEAQKLIARKNIGIDGTMLGQSDWKAAKGQAGYIANKPVIPEKTSQLINDNYTVIDPNYEDRVFANLVEKTNTFNRITTNEEDIQDLKDEQIEQNEEIANLKKKSYWVGSIKAFDEASDTDAKKAAELTKYVKDKLGVDPAEGNNMLPVSGDWCVA